MIMKTSKLPKKFAFLFALFILSLYSMRADASIYSSNYIYVTGTIAKTGSTAELRLNMHNTFSVSSWQCDLYLPEGITFKSIALVNDRHPKGYEAEVTTVVNGNGSE